MRRNIDFVRGQTETFSGVLRDASGAVDLTSATLTWRVGDPVLDSTILTLTESDGITVTAGTGGQWSITITPTHTADLATGHYTHQGEAVIGSATYGFTSGRLRLRKDLS